MEGDAALQISIVYVPNLQQTLVRSPLLCPQRGSVLLQGKGWSEHQLLTGVVQTLGRLQLDLRLPLLATDLELAQAVEDAWGVSVAEQAYRWRCTTLTVDLQAPRPLAELAFGASQRLLLSSGSPASAGVALAPGSGTATALRSPTQVVTVEAEGLHRSEEPAIPGEDKRIETVPFSGQGRILGDATPGLSVSERRERAASAALARQR